MYTWELGSCMEFPVPLLTVEQIEVYTVLPLVKVSRIMSYTPFY